MKPDNNSTTVPMPRRPIEEYVRYLINAIVKLFKDDYRFVGIADATPQVDLNYVNGDVIVNRITFLFDNGHTAFKATSDGICICDIDKNKAELLIGYHNWSIFEQR